jgi:hypothetical protein
MPQNFFPQLLPNDLHLREKDVGPTFISRFITGEESWTYGYDPETKQQFLK